MRRSLMSSKWDGEFTDWLNECEVKLIRAARRIAYDNQNAEDIFQEAMLDVYKRWAKVRLHPNIEAYVIKVMYSKHIDLRRNWARRRVEKETTWEYAEAIQDPIDASEGWLEAAALQLALRELNPSQRSVLVLTYMYSMPMNEVAKTLNIPQGTVASQLARGREAIAKYLYSSDQITRSTKLPELTLGEIENAEIIEEGDL